VTDAPLTDAEIEIEAKAADRVVFFSDAVIAIAITLLALELPLPPDLKNPYTNGKLLDALGHNWDIYLDFLVSFAVIGNHWATHRRIFRYVNRIDGVVARLNMLWLLMMILTPVATKLLSGNGGRGVRFSVYAVVLTIATLCLWGMRERTVHGNMLLPDAPESARHPDWVTYVTLVVLFALSAPLAFVTSYPWVCYVVTPAVSRVLHLLTGTSSGPRRPGHRGGRAGPAHRG
jgi:uncharacterized membrane protein